MEKIRNILCFLLSYFSPEMRCPLVNKSTVIISGIIDLSRPVLFIPT